MRPELSMISGKNLKSFLFAMSQYLEFLVLNMVFAVLEAIRAARLESVVLPFGLGQHTLMSQMRGLFRSPGAFLKDKSGLLLSSGSATEKHPTGSMVVIIPQLLEI
jgi:hypothetical protein